MTARKLSRWGLLTACALVSAPASLGCARVDVARVQGPDGSREWYAITCTRDQARCYKAAGDVCPGGYKATDMGGSVSLSAYTAGQNVYLNSRYQGSILVKCDVDPPRARPADLPVCTPDDEVEGVPCTRSGRRQAPVAEPLRPPPSLRECVDDDVCRLGEHCRFAADAEKGKCVYAPQP